MYPHSPLALSFQPQRPRVPRLEFVSGSRCLASLWIVCQHFSPHSSDGALVKALWRSDAAVDYFIVLSGFVTHWASRGAFAALQRHRDDAARWRDGAKRWYGRRFGRVLLATYLAMAASWAMVYAAGGDAAPGHVGRCFLLVESWLAPARWCPDGQTWTVAALAPSWLLYPAVYDRLVYERPARILAPLGLALAVLPTAVAAGLLRRGDAPFGSVHDAMYLWPPAQLCDFLLGVVSAELAATHAARPRWRLAAPGADASCLAVAALVLFAPNPRSRYRTGAEELFDHGLAPLFAVFLYCAARDATALEGEPGSIFAALCRHDAPRSLGRASFEIYLFQWPLHAAFSAVGLDTKSGGENFAAYVLALCVAAVCYEAYVERPYVAWLRDKFRPLEPLGAERSASSSSLPAF